MEIGRIVQLMQHPSTRMAAIDFLREKERVNTYISNDGKNLKVLRWQSEPPTKPGYYWACGPDTSVMMFDFGYWLGGNVLAAYLRRRTVPKSIDWMIKTWGINYWLGPLPEPEPPA